MKVLYIRPSVDVFQLVGVPRPTRDGGISAKQSELLRELRRAEQELQREAEKLLAEYGVRPLVGLRTPWTMDGRGDPREVLYSVSPEALVIRAELSVEADRVIKRIARRLKEKWQQEETLQSKLEAVLKRLEEEAEE